MVTQQVALEQVVHFAAELLRLAVPVRQVVLFGSYARNEQHQWSDIDVAIVADSFSGAGPFDIIPFAHLFEQYVDIEPHTFSPKQFTNWNPFVQEIMRSGIVIGEWEPIDTETENRAIHL